MRNAAAAFAVATLLAAPVVLVPSTADARSERTAARSHRNEARPARTPQASRTTTHRPTAQRATTNRHTANRRRVRSSRHASADAPRMPDRPRELLPVAMGSTLNSSTFMQGGPRAACLDGTRRAEQIHGLPRGLLTAIALSESGLHAYAMNIGGRTVIPEDGEAAARLLRAASSRRTVMAGCLQINARVHARGETWPLDARISTDWAGGVLARWGHELGWDEALRRWHGASTRNHARLVCRVRAKLDVVNPDSTLFQEYDCNPGREARTRANGEAHFAAAEQQL
ncbi:hypothetical protein EOD42_01300 [Rhodovarius crocodyli]|uniref:Transglycosylase SLT domain-containing protein n=1 Tax=Rhodovarius crocodyli TaxID=1979269 RepID=A0A437MMB2_9PROT|nr:hypothetical protein [Rhodovarius crocodyli]RVT98775.1 hypothetical protein EOD42_01300 [Rhodovarius crocodyli]